MIRTILALCILLLGANCALAFSEQPAVNPRSYHSASGKYALYVDPSDRDGRGPAFYRLSTKKGVVWSGTLPFTFTQAIVSERGVFAGYAHTEGINGLPLKKATLGPGESVVATIGPDGKVRHRETTKRQHSAAPDAPPEPIGVDILLHESADRFSVCRSDYSWQFFSLSTGQPQAKLDPGAIGPIPETARLRTSMRARALPGTPLSLANWVTQEEVGTQSYGLLFMLVDVAGHPVWSVHQPAGFPADDDFPWEKLTEDWAILKTSDPRRFDLWFFADQQRVTFSVDQDPKAEHGWRVAEVAREKYTAPEPPAAAAAPAIEERALPKLGEFVLQDGHTPQPIRDINSFAFDQKGRIGFLRSDGRFISTFVLIEPAGKVIAEIALPKVAIASGIEHQAVAAVGEGRWVFTAGESRIDGKCWAWWLDAEKGAWTEIAGYEGPAAKSITSLGDGGLVVMGTRWPARSVFHELRAYDREGKTRWTVKSDFSLDDGALFSPEAIARTGAGELAVLDNIRKTVQFFDTAGKYLRIVDLKKACGREPAYLSELWPGRDGGLIVYDYSGKSPFVCMSATGIVVAQWTPSSADGRANANIRMVSAAPDGQWWATDTHALMRLNDNGQVEQTLGVTPAPEQLGTIARAGADATGRLYALDQQTGAVHVFDPEGRSTSASRHPAIARKTPSGRSCRSPVTAPCFSGAKCAKSGAISISTRAAGAWASSTPASMRSTPGRGTRNRPTAFSWRVSTPSA